MKSKNVYLRFLWRSILQYRCTQIDKSTVQFDFSVLILGKGLDV